MTRRIKATNDKIFWLELMLVSLNPFVICWSMIPTNILNSNFLLGLLELIGVAGSALILIVGVPLGIIGLLKARVMEKRRVATIVLSIINLSAAIIEIAILVLIFCSLIFGGAFV